MHNDMETFLSLAPPRDWKQAAPELKKRLLGPGWWAYYIADGIVGVFILLVAIPMAIKGENPGTIIGVALGMGLTFSPILWWMHRTRKSTQLPFLEGNLVRATLLYAKEEKILLHETKKWIHGQQCELRVQTKDGTFDYRLFLEDVEGEERASLDSELKVLFHPKIPKYARLFHGDRLHALLPLKSNH